DGDASTRADLRRAAKWAITGAVTSALMCASGVLAGERLSEQAVNPALLEEDLSEVVGRMAAACAVGGLLPGVVVAFLSGGGLRGVRGGERGDRRRTAVRGDGQPRLDEGTSLRGRGTRGGGVCRRRVARGSPHRLPVRRGPTGVRHPTRRRRAARPARGRLR